MAKFVRIFSKLKLFVLILAVSVVSSHANNPYTNFEVLRPFGFDNPKSAGSPGSLIRGSDGLLYGTNASIRMDTSRTKKHRP